MIRHFEYIYKFAITVGRGIGQVMFQDNAFSGILMLVGIAMASWQMALLALAGNIIGTLTAYVSGYDRNDIHDGLYGFNGTLVGIAVGVFLSVNAWSVLIMAMASVLSAWIVRLFSIQDKFSGFTAPFILATWVMLALVRWCYPSLLLPVSISTVAGEPDFFQAFCMNVGQVMFQGGTVLAGLFFLLGITVNSRTNALYTVFGATLPIFVALLMGVDCNPINAGLLGYNGVLCAIALGDMTVKSFVAATIGIILSILMQYGGMLLGATTLTAPFVVSTWMVVWGMKVWDGKRVRHA